MGTLIQDLRFGLRVLAKNPGFTAVAVITLALGIGSTTAIFSVVYGVLLRPLPYPNASRIVDLREVNAHGGGMHFADPNFYDLRSQSHSLEGVAEYGDQLESVSGGNEPSRTTAAAVSSDFFSVMGVQPVVGRNFAPEDQREGAAPVALVSYGYWKQNLGGAEDLSKLKLMIGSRSYTVIGVLPPGFRFPDGSDLWLPRELDERLPSRTAHNWKVVARLRDGVPLAQARAELTGIARRLKQQYGQDTMMTDVAVTRLQDALTRAARPALWILLGAVGCLLLVACANVANLLLAQAAARERELAIRAALGAGRGRLLRQFLTEAILLSSIGGALGVIAALWGVEALLAIAPSNVPRLQHVSINFPVLLFSLGISLLVAVGLGAFTALRATSGASREALAGRESGGTGTSRGHHLGRVIVAAQLAITLVLLVGAGLLGRSLLRVLSVDPGFQTAHILTMGLALPGPAAWDTSNVKKIQRVQFLDALLSRLRALPGVLEVGGANGLPLTSRLSDGTYVLMNPQQLTPRIQDLIKRSLNGSLDTDPSLLKEFSNFFDQIFHSALPTGDADYCVASAGYFRALGIPLLHGRFFNAGDTTDGPPVALISESLAREKWPKRDPLGHSIEFGNMDGDVRLLTVVGIVGDVREDSLEASPRPTIYVNYRQRPQATQSFTVVLRTGSSPAAIIPAARRILRSLDPNVPPSFSTFNQVFSASLKTRRFNLALLCVFAASALLLAVAGIYGVMAYSVQRRTHEIGVRIALGARAGDVQWLVLSQATLTTVAGVVFGVAGSMALTRTMQSLLFGVSATDPATFAGVALLLAIVALLASYIPARRATKVDPMVALRNE